MSFSSFGRSSSVRQVAGAQYERNRLDLATPETYTGGDRGYALPAYESGTGSFGESLGRSYGASFQARKSPAVHTGDQVHEQSANLAGIGVTEDSDEDQVGPVPLENAPSIEPARGSVEQYNSVMSPNSGFLSSYYDDQDINAAGGSQDTAYLRLLKEQSRFYSDSNPKLLGVEADVEANKGTNAPQERKGISDRNINIFAKIILYLPSVFLGTLLNILDGLSYGMIMFPLSEPIFAGLGPTGLSIFYVSCVISQLIYSLGGSAFKAGIGSEMIEVTPFFHTMAISILHEIGSDNKDAVMSTTVVAYAILSIVTGLVFYLLGKLRLGVLVGFFPRHILVGCIGGIGYFLLVTGIGVSSRMEGTVSMSLETLQYLFQNWKVFLQWTVPIVLSTILVILESKIHSSLLVPIYFICILGLFHLVVFLVPGWNLHLARDSGWVFPAVSGKEPWYAFYKLYNFEVVNWLCVLKQIPTMLALAFFGVLHVPINVPALAVTIGMDDFDVDRELVAHGYSNAISGLCGSIQNYLVYTNSVLFIRAGADSRLAGVLLAGATMLILSTGPVIIGFIPVCVVGSLIFLLGYELVKEALYDTWSRVRRIEYTTILIIVVVMGAWDFVYGVLVGILLACLLFVIEAARRPVVRGIYTGVVARSTVLRHPKQQEFLKNIGDQICVLKLEGTLFFGSIGGVEEMVRSIFKDDNPQRNLIKYLILDMKGVASIDFSAAEGFRRIFNFTHEFNVQLIISSVTENDDKVKSLRDAGLWDTGKEPDIQLFNSLNYALEWCENSFLVTYKQVGRAQNRRAIGQQVRRDSSGVNGQQIANLYSRKKLMAQFMDNYGTPRTNQLYAAATKTVNDEQRAQSKFYSTNDQIFKKQPLPLIMITFQGLSDKDEVFWSNLTPFLIKEHIPENYTFYSTIKDKPSFFLVESGLIRSVCRIESDSRELHSSILPMTAFGELSGDCSNYRDVLYTAVSNTITWKLTLEKIEELLLTESGRQVYIELLKIHGKLLRERFDSMTANLVISA